jgi:hypothetical protein
MLLEDVAAPSATADLAGRPYGPDHVHARLPNLTDDDKPPQDDQAQRRDLNYAAVVERTHEVIGDQSSAFDFVGRSSMMAAQFSQ